MQWTDYVPIGIFQAVVTAITWFCASYLKEKGKNLATKEDIHEITDKIESVKIEYAKELEGLKSHLSARFHAYTVRYAKEFRAYGKIWKALLEIRNATVKLRPAADSFDPRESEEERKRKRLERFSNAFDCLYPAVYENKPFFPPDLFNRLEELLKLMNIEAFEYSRRSYQRNALLYDPKYFDTAEANAAKIREETEAICELIRKRIESL